MGTLKGYADRMNPNMLANFIHRDMRRRKVTNDAKLCGLGGHEGVGVYYEAVKVTVGDKTYLVEVTEQK